jgi:hypothetical protein
MSLRNRHPDETKEDRAHRHVRNSKIEKWFWIATIPPYVWWMAADVQLAVVGFLSIYALVKTLSTEQRAGEAELAGREDS